LSIVKSVLYVMAACTLGLATGCGPESKVALISGSVNIDGTPVDKGSIAFAPVDGKGPSGGGEIVGGKYKCDAALGECKVEIRVPKSVGKRKLYDTPESPMQEIFEEVLPQKYNEATELRVQVQKGKNEKNWDLNTK
jgi:hypothetical protein